MLFGLVTNMGTICLLGLRRAVEADSPDCKIFVGRARSLEIGPSHRMVAWIELELYATWLVRISKPGVPGKSTNQLCLPRLPLCCWVRS